MATCKGADPSAEPEALSSIDVVVMDDDARAPAVSSTLMSRRDPAIGESSTPRERPALIAGQILGGRYRMERRVGSGGMG